MSTHLVALLVALLTATAASAPIVGPSQPSVQPIQSCSILSDKYGLFIRVATDGSVMVKEGEEKTEFLLHYNGNTVQFEAKDRIGSFLMLHPNITNGTSNSTAGDEVSARKIEVGVPTESTMSVWTSSDTHYDVNNSVTLSQKTDSGDCYVEFGLDGAICADAPGENTQIYLYCV